MHLTDRQTDGHNCDSNTMHCITCSHAVKIIHELHRVRDRERARVTYRFRVRLTVGLIFMFILHMFIFDREGWYQNICSASFSFVTIHASD